MPMANSSKYTSRVTRKEAVESKNLFLWLGKTYSKSSYSMEQGLWGSYAWQNTPYSGPATKDSPKVTVVPL